MAARNIRERVNQVLKDYTRVDNPILSPYGQLVRGLRVELGELLYHQAQAMRLRPSELSALETGKASLTDEHIAATKRYFAQLGIEPDRLAVLDELPRDLSPASGMPRRPAGGLQRLRAAP